LAVENDILYFRISFSSPAAPVAAVAALTASAEISAAGVRLVVPAADAAVTSSPSRRVAVKMAAIVSWLGLVMAAPARVGPCSCALLCPTSAAAGVAGIRVAVFSLPSQGGCHLPWLRSGLVPLRKGVSRRMDEPGQRSRRP